MINWIHSQILPIELTDIDTDMVIPAQFMTTVRKEGLGQYAFLRVREQNPDFIMNRAKYQEAKIMVVGANFGCGSSREHAAWALRDWGIQAVLAPSFADLFYNNALKNQILPILLPEMIIEKIFDDEKTSLHYLIEISLEKQQVNLPTGEVLTFDIDPYRKMCLLKGMDDLDYLLSKTESIKKYMDRHPPLYNISSIKTEGDR